MLPSKPKKKKNILQESAKLNLNDVSSKIKKVKEEKLIFTQRYQVN